MLGRGEELEINHHEQWEAETGFNPETDDTLVPMFVDGRLTLFDFDPETNVVAVYQYTENPPELKKIKDCPPGKTEFVDLGNDEQRRWVTVFVNPKATPTPSFPGVSW